LLLLAACGRLGFRSADADGGAADSTGDVGASGDIGGDASTCAGTTHLITDNFDDNTFDASVWGNSYEDSSSRHVEANGRLEIRIGANDADDWAGYGTSTVFQLEDDRVFVEVPIVNSQPGHTILLLWTSLAKTDGPSIEHEGTRLIFRRRVSDTINDLGSIPYDAAMHRWWQIRERNGTTFWETSPDAQAWTMQYQEPTPGATTAIITIAAGSSASNPVADLAVFDNLNGGGAPPLCP
jgi:hypothetical protein